MKTEYEEIMFQIDMLKNQILALQQRAEPLRAAEMDKAAATIRELMKQHGLTLHDLEPPKLKQQYKARTPTSPKYQDPNSGKTWSGAGKPPHWIKDQDRTKFLIQQAA